MRSLWWQRWHDTGDDGDAGVGDAAADDKDAGGDVDIDHNLHWRLPSSDTIKRYSISVNSRDTHNILCDRTIIIPILQLRSSYFREIQGQKASAEQSRLKSDWSDSKLLIKL